MAINKSYPGPQVVSKRFIVGEGLTSSDYSPVFSVHQPAYSVLEKVFVRVLEAPTIASGDIAIEVGTETDGDPTNIIDDGANLNNLLDGGTTIAVDTVFDMDSALATNIETTLRTEDTEINFRLRSSTAVQDDADGIAQPGKFEVSFVFRVFE